MNQLYPCNHSPWVLVISITMFNNITTSELKHWTFFFFYKHCVLLRSCILAPAKQWFKPTQKSLTFKIQEKINSIAFFPSCKLCKDVFPFHFSRILLGLECKKGREQFIHWHWIWTTHKQGFLLNFSWGWFCANWPVLLISQMIIHIIFENFQTFQINSGIFPFFVCC